MANITFGRKSLSAPTPASVSFVMKIIIALCSAVGIWMGTANFIPAKTSTVIQSFLSLAVIICVTLQPFFGVSPTPTTIPAKDVKEMESDPNKPK